MKRIFLICLFFTHSVYANTDYPLLVDINGKSILLNKKPTRVVVYDFAALDTLDLMGIEPIAIADGVLPNYLSAYRNKEKMIAGSLFKPNISVLKSLEPDLIIVGPRSKSALNDLSKIAPTIDMSVSPHNFLSDISRNLKVYGKIFDKQTIAKNYTQKLQTKVEKLRRKGLKQGSGLVLFTMKDEFIVHSPGDRFGMIYKLTGLEYDHHLTDKVFNKTTTDTPDLSLLEQGMAQNPDWLIILDRGLATGGSSQIGKAFEKYSIIQSSEAWTKKNVFYLNANQWYLQVAIGVFQTWLIRSV